MPCYFGASHHVSGEAKATKSQHGTNCTERLARKHRWWLRIPSSDSDAGSSGNWSQDSEPHWLYVDILPFAGLQAVVEFYRNYSQGFKCQFWVTPRWLINASCEKKQQLCCTAVCQRFEISIYLLANALWWLTLVLNLPATVVRESSHEIINNFTVCDIVLSRHSFYLGKAVKQQLQGKQTQEQPSFVS